MRCGCSCSWDYGCGCGCGYDYDYGCDYGHDCDYTLKSYDCSLNLKFMAEILETPYLHLIHTLFDI